MAAKSIEEVQRELKTIEEARERANADAARAEAAARAAGTRGEAAQAAAQKALNQRIRVRLAVDAKKRALLDLERALKQLKAVPPKSRGVALNTSDRSDSRIETQRLAVDAARRVDEADETIRRNTPEGVPLPTIPASKSSPQKRTQTGSGAAGPGFGLRETEAAAMTPTPGVAQPNTSAINVRAVQTRLVDAGYNLVVDGKWGPKSAAAWTDFTAKGGNMDRDAAAAPPPALAARRRTTIGVGPNASSPSATAFADPTSSAPMAPQLSGPSFRARVLAEMPEYAPFLDDPELLPLIQARIDNTISDAEFASRVRQTEFFKTTPATKRAWLALYAMDPATANRQVEERAAQYKAMLGDYAVDLADVTVQQWALKTLSGEVPEQGFADYLREQAKSLFPSLSAAIDAGITVRQYADPYVQRASKMLEVAPDSIDFTQERWRRALVKIDPTTGKRTAMDLSEWENLLRTDPSYGWDRTNQARSQAAELAAQLERTFGRVA